MVLLRLSDDDRVLNVAILILSYVSIRKVHFACLQGCIDYIQQYTITR